MENNINDLNDSEIKIPAFILLSVFIVAIFLSCCFTYFFLRNNTKELKKEKKKIEIKIDSLKHARVDYNKQIIDYSEENVKQSTNLIKKLPNEKTYISDTSYNAMCSYITKYSQK